MSEQKGFRVGLKERKVVLVAEQDGRELRLTHILRQPTTQDWIEYNRLVSKVQFQGRKTKVETNVLEARVWLYDKLIIRAEGYVDDSNGKPLAPDLNGWVEKIPALHKSEVINTFGEVTAKEELGKN